MDAWDKDRRLSGGAGWILDDSGEWVSTSGKPEVPASVAQAAIAASRSRRGPSRAWGLMRGLLVVLIVPALAAAATLYVWKGPGAELVLARIEPVMAVVEVARARISLPERQPETAAEPAAPVPDGPVTRSIVPLQADVSPAFDSHAPAALPECAAIRRGMGNGIVFHRTGGCED